MGFEDVGRVVDAKCSAVLLGLLKCNPFYRPPPPPPNRILSFVGGCFQATASAARLTAVLACAGAVGYVAVDVARRVRGAQAADAIIHSFEEAGRLDEDDAFESHYIECDASDPDAEAVPGDDAPPGVGKRRKAVRRAKPRADGVVNGPYLTMVVNLARDKFYAKGLGTDTEEACRAYMARVMREHGMREADIQRHVPAMVLRVFFVTEEELRAAAMKKDLMAAGRIKTRVGA